MANESAKVEYLDASQNARHYLTLRFTHLTIYVALTGALMNVLFARSTIDAPLMAVGVKLAGLLATVLYWVLQERTMAYWYVFVNRATELEKELGFEQYTLRPKPGPISSRWTIRMFFLALAVFWLVALIVAP